MTVDLLEMFPDEVVQLIEAQRVRDDDARAYVAKVRAAKVRPQLEYRCQRRCGLLRGWNTPRGLILAHPSFRLAGSRAAEKTWPGGDAHLGDVRDEGHFTVFPARAYLFVGQPPFLACEHRFGKIDPDQVRDDLTAALTTGLTVEQLVSVAQR